ncbi:MAG TPA: hypothetical protein VMO17_21720 [Terriglobia bacterium]|nr:hypothetical protein [Terriglobia bacterium]
MVGHNPTPRRVREACRCPLTLAAAFALLLALAPASRAQSDDSKPEELGKMRTSLYLKATHAPLQELSNEVNQIAIVSENCRIKHGATACGLGDKALESDKLEDRYAYYVKDPVEAHAKGHAVKIERGNWGAASAPAHAQR